MFVSAFLFSCIVLCAAALFFRSMRNNLRPILRGKPDRRTDHLLLRLRHMLKLAMSTRSRSRIIVVFCLLLVVIAIIEAFVEGAAGSFYPFRNMGSAYAAITFLQEVSCTAVVAFAIILLLRPLMLRTSRTDIPRPSLIIGMMALIAATVVTNNAVRIAAGSVEAGLQYPVSSMLAEPLIGHPSLALMMHVVWWTHIVLVLVFINILPIPRNMHVLTSIPNIFFSKMEERGALPPFHANNGTPHDAGAVDTPDLTWKLLLDGYSCTECGRCDTACPAHQADLPLSPQKIIMSIRTRTDEHFRNGANGRTRQHGAKKNGSSPILHGYISDEELWSCTTCMACAESCPVFIEPVEAIVEFRRGLVMSQSRTPEDIAGVFRRLEEYGSPYTEASSISRTEWATGLGIPTLAEDAHHEILFWVGCAGAFDARSRNISVSVARLLQHAGIRFAILGDEERCTGDAARRLGNERLARSLMLRNIETLRRYRVKTIVTACPHCFNTFRNEYPVFGGRYTVMHHTEYLDTLLRTGRLITTHASTEPYIYHDPCYLSRGNGIHSAPRRILSCVSVAHRTELPQSKEETLCCGAGGGLMWRNDSPAKPLAQTLASQMVDTNCETIATACPFCLTLLDDELHSLNPSGQYLVRDVAELLSSAIDEHVKVSPHIHRK